MDLTEGSLVSVRMSLASLRRSLNCPSLQRHLIIMVAPLVLYQLIGTPRCGSIPMGRPGELSVFPDTH